MTVVRLYAQPEYRSTHLNRRDAGIVEGRRPLGGDAHFHIAERLPGCVQQHITGDIKSDRTQLNLRVQYNKIIKKQTDLE